MVHSLREEQIEQLAATVVQGMREKKARDIVTLDLRHIPNTVCDFFVICSGDSSTHVEGISGSVQEMTRKQLNDRPWHVEGLGNSEWVLLDYVNVVVHVFQREPRDYYSIERLWADAIITEHDEDGTDVVFKAAGKKPAKAAVKVAKALAKKAPAKKPAAKAPARAKNAAAKPAVRTVKSALAKTAKAPAKAAKTAVKSATVPAKKVAAKPAAKAKSAAAKPAKAASKTVKAAAAKTAKAPIKTAKAPAKSAKTPAKKASRA